MLLAICLLVLGTTWVTAPDATGGDKVVLFPLQHGNVWVLEATPGDRRVIRCEREGKKLLRITGLLDQEDVFFGKPGGVTLSRMDPLKNKIRKALKLPAFKTTRSLMSVGALSCDQLECILEPTEVIILSDTDLFFDCSMLHIATADHGLTVCRELLAERVYFAPDVGPVQIHGKLDRVYRLVHARVGGEIFGQNEVDGVSGFLKADSGSYTNFVNSLPCRNQVPCPSNEQVAVARLLFEVFNDSFTEKRIRYVPGESFDLVLYDESGQQVTSWSEQTNPPRSLTQLILPPGDFHAFELEIALRGSEGLPLAGRYRVSAFIEGEDGTPDAADFIAIDVLSVPAPIPITP